MSDQPDGRCGLQCKHSTLFLYSLHLGVDKLMCAIPCEQRFIHVHLFQRSNGKSPDDSHCLHYTGPFGEVSMVFEQSVCMCLCTGMSLCMCAWYMCIMVYVFMKSELDFCI